MSASSLSFLPQSLSPEQDQAAPAAETTAPLNTPLGLQGAGGGGNNMVLGLMDGQMDVGTRQNDDGSTSYGHQSDGWFGGIFDSIDRMMARAELAGDYDIVDENFVGPRLPNQVTQEEFDRIATLYSDIRRGNTNFQFDTAGMTDEEAASFQTAAMGDMRKILTTSAGRDLLDDLAYGDNNGNNYTTTLRNAANPATANANIPAGGDWLNTGNGTGSSQVVTWQAGTDFDISTYAPDYGSAPWRDFTSDTVLFHELTHARHMRDGTVPLETDGSGNFTGFTQVGATDATIPADATMPLEEYNTVGLGPGAGPYTENGYRAERSLVTGTNIPQRTSYAGPGPAPAAPP